MSAVLSDSELESLWRRAFEDGITLLDLEPYCIRHRQTVEWVLNELALTLARRFASGALDYEFCDEVMNGLLKVIVDVAMSAPMPRPAFCIYQAFDGGEYLRVDDPPDVVPHDKYTRPALEEILRQY